MSETITTLVGWGVLLVHIGLLVALLAYFFFRSSVPAGLVRFLQEKGILLGFLTAVFLIVGSLYFSEVVGFPVCELCWWQRIFLYPSAVLLGLALWKKDPSVTRYVIALSGIAFVIGTYHHLIQLMPGLSAFCGAEIAQSCTVRYLFELGYITFPMLGMTGAALLIFFMLFARKRI